MRTLALWLICMLLAACAQAEAPRYYTRGDVVADVQLTTWDGQNVSLSTALSEKEAVVLHFFTMSCGGCEEEMPLLRDAYAAWGERVALIAVTIDEACTDKQLETYCTRRGLVFPVARATAELVSRYPIYGMPSTFVIDRDGVLREIKEGALVDLAAFEALITPWLADAAPATE